MLICSFAGTAVGFVSSASFVDAPEPLNFQRRAGRLMIFGPAGRLLSILSLPVLWSRSLNRARLVSRAFTVDGGFSTVILTDTSVPGYQV
jgi:hypothetical protein